MLLLGRSSKERMEAFGRLLNVLSQITKEMKKQCAYVCASLFKMLWIELRGKESTKNLLMGMFSGKGKDKTNLDKHRNKL